MRQVVFRAEFDAKKPRRTVKAFKNGKGLVAESDDDTSGKKVYFDETMRAENGCFSSIAVQYRNRSHLLREKGSLKHSSYYIPALMRLYLTLPSV